MTFGIAGLLIFAGANALRKSDNVGFILLPFGLIFLAMSFLILKHYLKILNRIEIGLDGIIIEGLLKRKTIGWDEVDALNLTGKEPEKFMFTSMPMEALSITGLIRDIR